MTEMSSRHRKTASKALGLRNKMLLLIFILLFSAEEYLTGALHWNTVDSVNCTAGFNTQCCEDINLCTSGHQVPAKEITDCEGLCGLECYKKTTHPDDPLLCTWKSGRAMLRAQYTLHYCAQGKDCLSFDAGTSTSCCVKRYDLQMKLNMAFWVQARATNTNIISRNITVNLTKAVKPDPPVVLEMNKSSGNLHLSWKKAANEMGGSLNEIHIRRLNDSHWHNGTCETTSKKETSEHCSVQVDSQPAYELQIRTIPKKNTELWGFWSEWSSITFVPAEIQEPPQLHFVLMKLESSGTRSLILKWTAPHNAMASLGEIEYNLTISMLPEECRTSLKSIRMNTTEYTMNISNAGYRVSLVAFNKAGQSPKKTVLISPGHTEVYRANRTVVIDRIRQKQHCKKVCTQCQDVLETQPSESCGTYTGHKRKITENYLGKMKNLTRYRITVHCLHEHETETYEVYLAEGTPKNGPSNISMQATHNSVLVTWTPIAIDACQGFLLKYRIYYSTLNERNQTQVAEIDGGMTEYEIQNLSSNTMYKLEIAGTTAQGEGVRSITHFQTSQRVVGIILQWTIVAVSVCILSLTGVPAIRRIKKVLLSAIPSPECSSAMNFPTQAPIPLQALRCEEEDEAEVLVVLEKSVGPPPVKDTALMRAEESGDSDHRDSSSESGSLAGFESNFNPHYKTQVLNHPELEGHESHDEAPLQKQTQCGAV
ncbi:interleukin-12 receptor subunit beta-1-like isoform X2 [Polyodon spathula]|uniref:interleukin-12 receptor subunit beta-1-like isoform X2 n=1 Tax=Polyodon spathula TaxID=7913 RepID=UPI001B7E3273|nr:interleukin-12 receptor subunit beta-1-like isoform X2 [Polyodon spathula]